MKEYCVDLELAKELKENGFPQKSTFYWWINTQGKPHFSYGTKYDYSAPTSDEILKELPDGIRIVKQIGKNSGIFTVACPIGNQTKYFDNKKLSNCLALLWLYLKKEGYIK